MKSERRKQVITLSILAVAVLTLSIGFAAFSSVLNIKSEATVNPDASTFGVVFSSSSSALETNAVAANPSNLGESATIVNDGNPTISGLNAKFTSPGQSVTYTFYARNVGEYKAYLNAIMFKNATGGSSNKVCTAGTNTTDSLVQSACNGISISVKVGADTAVTSNTSGIANHTLASGSSEAVVVTISYASNSAQADGPFTVSFGDIELTYSTISNYVVEEEKTQVYKPQYYSWSSGNVGGDLPSDAKTTVAELNPSYPVYIGLDVEEGKVTAAYACFVRNETEYCLKGYDTGAFATNTDIIIDGYADVVDTDACSFAVDDSLCYGDGSNARATSSGYVSADDGDGRCIVSDGGSFDCYD